MITSRSASARWSGSGTEGNGSLSTASRVLQEAQYSYLTRFADGIGTNPEELIAAAHASCFSMKLAFNLQAAGLAAASIDTRCQVAIENATVVSSHLQVRAAVTGLAQTMFEELVQDAQYNCPISKLINVPITVEATLL